MRSGITVVTVVSGRHDHLRAQRRFLAACVPAADRHVVVAVDDAGIDGIVVDDGPQACVVHVESSVPGCLPIAAARNRGAQEAIASGAQVLVFLDVDCLPSTGLLGTLHAALGSHPDALVCGPVTYLPPTPAAGWTATLLDARRSPHAARPDPAPGTCEPLAPELFWSLNFAVAPDTWCRLGGFWEGYVGYGAEDTDLGCSAAAAGAPMMMAGGADAFHQHHTVSNPPVEHVDDIVRNAAVFQRRHGAMPMPGWLDAFERDALITREPLRRTSPVRVATVPARHEYLDAALPGTVERAATGRVTGWEPDPLLTVDGLSRVSHEVDVVHVHFGYDHVEPDQLTAWTRELQRRSMPLVVTVHDLRNPHHDDRDRHDAHLRILLGEAAHVITLTGGAADEIAQRFGRRPEVVAHPTLLDSLPSQPPRRSEVLVPLKALRRNVVEPNELLAAVAAAGAPVRALVDPRVVDRIAPVDGVEFEVTGRLPHAELEHRLAAAHAVVLPYRFGTHSGWVELARDLGVHVVAPDCGYFAEQWSGAISYRANEADGLDAPSLTAAVTEAMARPPAAPADRRDREQQRDLVRARHDVLYRSLAPR